MADTDDERISELTEDNRRLRRLLDQRDAPGELRHRLRSTLAMLRAIIKRSAHAGRDLPSYVAHLEDRLDAIVRAQAFADENGEVDLRTLLADEMFLYGLSEGERLVLAGPAVRLTPRAGQVMALALHELAVNAVEHGPLGEDTGTLDVTWAVSAAEPERLVTLVWSERGGAGAFERGPEGFGTDVLTHMLGWEFKAQTDPVYAPGGLRCTIMFPLTERIGCVA